MDFLPKFVSCMQEILKTGHTFTKPSTHLPKKKNRKQFIINSEIRGKSGQTENINLNHVCSKTVAYTKFLS